MPNRLGVLRPQRLIAGIVVLLFGLSLFAGSPRGETASAWPGKTSTPNVSVVEAYGKLRFAFEANQRQSDPQVKFLSRGTGYGLFLTGNEAVLALQETPGKSPRWSTRELKPGRKRVRGSANLPCFA
jgi:hypothetical protein